MESTQLPGEGPSRPLPGSAHPVLRPRCLACRVGIISRICGHSTRWACPTWCLLCRFVVRSAPRECSLMDPIPEAHVSALPPTPHAQLGGFGQVSLPVCIPVSPFVKCQSIESCFPGLPPQLLLSADQKKMTAESFVRHKMLGSVREGSVTWNSSSPSHLPGAGVDIRQ